MYLNGADLSLLGAPIVMHNAGLGVGEAQPGKVLAEPSSGGTSPQIKMRAMCLVCWLVVLNVVVLCTLLLIGAKYPRITSPGILAFTFGLRHAVDADHIATIDNVTRKLVQDGSWPLTVGLWFSLGHSSVVCIMCIAVVIGRSFIKQQLINAERVGAIVGTAVSATMLLTIGSVNMFIAYRLLCQRQKVSRRSDTELEALERYVDHHNETLSDGECRHHQRHHCESEAHDQHTHVIVVSSEAEITGPGFLVNCCPRVLMLVDSPIKMFPVGFLFGLGFDTASEVALLSLAALAPEEGVPVVCVLVLPLLFSVGMALIDTLDGLMMLWAYGWAVVDPARKIMFNLFLTASSALIAIFVGIVEVLGCLQEQFRPAGKFWHFIRVINDNFQLVGYCILVFFALSSFVAVLKLRGS